ncbi:MAG: hypothetical protein J5987_02295, partial [Phascolarctobacterium sp.]|nr:hypothetical protein [Phascolarctobacterium sp.]
MVLLSCTTLFPWQAMAEDDLGEYIYNFTYDGSKYFDAIVLTPGQETEVGVTREFEAYEKKSFQEQALVYLGDITGKPKWDSPIILLAPADVKDFNASAYSPVDKVTANTEYGNYFIGSGVQDNNGEPIASITIDSAVDGYRWYADEYPILPLNGLDSDYPGAVVHEMVHAMGVGAYNIISINNVDVFPVEYNLKFTDGLYDALGRKLTTLTATGGYLPVESITKEEYVNLKNDNSLVSDDVFYVIKYEDVGTNGGVYFSGTNVQSVLGIGTKIAWPDEVDVEPVPGIPINCYEGDYLELSHLELQNSLMSHQMYRNWCTLMEAELALLQDIGYVVEREKFFGQSIYASGATSLNISDLANGSGASWNSNTDRAIGLHIYGSNNNVTLENGANITANGSYSMGVRVDGVGNDLTIASNININVGNEPTDKYNYGISVNYGKGHNVTISSGASVVAQGKESIGAIFDFGSNELSDAVEYRGSYIRGAYSDDAGSFENNEEELFGNELTDSGGPLGGALVENFIVNGTLQGEKAIYISPNTLVKTINVMDGATVEGDIISEWNPEGVEYFYTRDYGGENPYRGLNPNIPAGANLDNYRTNLNLAGNRTFTDNIIGPYGLIMNVNSGKLTTANASTEDSSYINVHSVNVGDGATYTVNNVLMANNGYGAINVMGNGSLALAEDTTNNSVGTILIAFNNEDGDGHITSGIINNDGAVNFQNGELALKPDGVYFEENTKVKILKKANDNDNGITDGEKFSGIWFVDMNGEKAQVAESDNDSYKITKTLTMTAEQGSGSESNFVSITTERSF